MLSKFGIVITILVLVFIFFIVISFGAGAFSKDKVKPEIKKYLKSSIPSIKKKDTIDLIDLHKEVLLEESEYIYRYSYNEYFKGISDNDLIEMCQEYITSDMDKEDIESIEDGDNMELVISILENNIKGIEIES